MTWDRKRVYLAMMGTCVLLIVLAWTLVWRWSVPAAAVMSIVAALLPPAASTVANFGVLSGRRRLDFEERPTRPERDPDR